MRLRCDFAERVAVDTAALDWVASPAPGVWRRMLDRDGDEVARATSIVRYDAGCRFERHAHGLGEEFLVLDGVFADEAGRYPRGTYVRNPAGTSHAPFTAEGCTLFVKLRQLSPQDQRRVVVDTTRGTWQPGAADGIEVMPLASFGAERTLLLRAQPTASWMAQDGERGEELLVLDGDFADARGRHGRGTWLRGPCDSARRSAGREGCTLFVKTGHLPI